VSHADSLQEGRLLEKESPVTLEGPGVVTVVAVDVIEVPRITLGEDEAVVCRGMDGPVQVLGIEGVLSSRQLEFVHLPRAERFRGDVVDVLGSKIPGGVNTSRLIGPCQGPCSSYALLGRALANISDPDVCTLFVELRDEETEHVRMIEEAIAKLPPNANIELDFDLDESPSL